MIYDQVVCLPSIKNLKLMSQLTLFEDNPLASESVAMDTSFVQIDLI